MWIDDWSTPSTMTSSVAADPSHAHSQVRTSPTDLPAQQAPKKLVTWDFDLTIRAFFPPPAAPTKFNPIHMMNTLFQTMLKDKPPLLGPPHPK